VAVFFYDFKLSGGSRLGAPQGRSLRGDWKNFPCRVAESQGRLIRNVFAVPSYLVTGSAVS
jgi:hypothetical protein